MHKIPAGEPVIEKEEIDNVLSALKSGWVSSKGSFINEFERNFSNYIGVKTGVAVTNGTVALHLALTSLGIGHGDEVILPDLTFVSPASMTVLSGAKPVFIDVTPDYWCINPEKIREKITSKTKAIIIVHLYGHPANMDPILEIAKEKNIYLIEDCAEAHGAEYNHKKVGNFSDISCFSFYGNKIITTGEGGICTTNNDEIADNLRLYRDHGMRENKRFWHEVIGFNYRMTNLQAALGVAQLPKIDKFIARKREIANLYKSILDDNKFIRSQIEMPWAKNSYWFYSILVNKTKRNKLMDFLKNEGIETRPFFYPIHVMPPYTKYSDEEYPISSKLASSGINLPSHVSLKNEEIQYISKKINDFFK